MAAQVAIVSLAELAIAVVAATVASLAWQYRDRGVGRALAVLAGSITLWAIANGLHSLVNDDGLTIAFSHAAFLFATLSAIAWFYVAVEYTDEKRLKRPVVNILMGSFALVFFVIIVTDPIHQEWMDWEGYYVADAGYLVFSGHTPALVQVIGNYTLFFVGFGLFAWSFLNARGIYRKQTGIILLGSFTTVGFVVVQFLYPTLLPGFSFSIAGMAVASLALHWAIFRVDFLKTVPVAREVLVESMDDAVVAVDADDTVVDLNPQARALLGVDKDAIGADVTSVFAPYADSLSEFADAYDTEAQVTLDQNDQTRHYDLSISPVGPDGVNRGDATAVDNVGRILVMRDVTAQVRQQNQLEEQKARLQEQKAVLERQNDRLDKFASVISHDLRNPLNMARGYLDVARETDDESQFEKVEQAHIRMETMIEELLTLARTDTAIEETESVTLSSLVDDAWETAQTDGATLENAFPPGFDIDGDSGLLRNIFENLFRNAVDHNDPPLTVRTGVLTDGGGFYVEDTGTGIPETKRADVFEFGFSTDSEGTGFGLAIVEEFVEAHGWTITVSESQEGGARFEVRTGGQSSSATDANKASS
jgi:signal transduction histidine kinase